MKRFLLPRIIALLLCAVLMVCILAGCNNNSVKASAETNSIGNSPTKDKNDIVDNRSNQSSDLLSGIDLEVEPTPANYTKLAKDLKALYQEYPDDVEIALAYVEKLVQLGNVEDAKTVLGSCFPEQTTNPQAIFLYAQIAYLTGDYERAEILYDKLFDDFPAYRGKAEFGLQFVYYQTNQYQKSQKLSGDYESRTGVGELMRAYGDREPYRVSWENEQETIVPFVANEPLPVVEVEINGQIRYFILDTGASDTYLDESLSEELGLETVATQTAPYAGGVEVVTNYGILDMMKMNGATLEAIPVNIADMSHLADIAGEEYELSGIIGIGVFKQFLVTIDYINGALILKPRGEHAEHDTDDYQVPFILSELHFTLCKATINGKPINIWTDSGLAADASLLLTDGSMDYVGIPLPEMFANPDNESGGLGGADFSTGEFTADTFKMGNLPTVQNIKGLHGILPGSGYEEEVEIFLDGIISHNFLKAYKWTIDFDTMTMTFSN